MFFSLQIAKGFSVKSDGRFFRITFRSNDRLDGTGFRASYTFEIEKPTTEIPSVVSDTLNSSSGIRTLSMFNQPFVTERYPN